ncbi:SpoIIE family protein phosphatase [Streptomyces sp. NPDC056529]|uniref:SpoIIE family protein phosphatase n=1 Tax=Streptomyces sp. NPDC056529 TaxID=3345855 RepID=UPI00369AB203
MTTGDESTAAETEHAVLKAVFAQQAVGLYVLDGKMRIIRANTNAAAVRSESVDAMTGKRFTDVFGLEDPEAEETVAREVLATGVPVIDRLVRGRDSPDGRSLRVYSVTTTRLQNDRGDILGLTACAVDVTESERTRHRKSVLGAVRERVGRRLDVVAVCEELVDAVVPAFSGTAVVEVVEAVVRGEDPPFVPVDQDVPLRRAAFKGDTPARPVGDIRHPPHGTPFARVLTDLHPRVVPVDEDATWLRADPARAEAARASGAHSLLVVALELRGEVFGTVSFYRHGQEEPFDGEDVQLASAVCTHAALCIDNARRYARERAIAATVQRRALPQRPVDLSTVEISPLVLAAPEGGGAWFDAIPMSGARTALIVGDVAGRGMAAATAMGQLRTALCSLVALDLDADELLARLNDTVVRLAAERTALPAADPLHREPLTAGCVIAVYDPVDLTCTIARAGLPEPLIVGPEGSSHLPNAPAGPILGGPDNTPFATVTVQLREKSVLAMGTSGPAGRSPEHADLVRTVLERSPGQDLRDLCDALAYAWDAGDRRDEALVLLVRTKRLPAERVVGYDLPHGPEAAPMARAAVRDQLEHWRVGDETAITAELVVSELVGNAVRYGKPPIRLRMILDRVLTCEVADTSMSSPHVRHARLADETGRGLFIVASVAANWGTRYHDQGKTVWAELPAGPPHGG